MDIFQAIILGFVQGITEFLPISSSAHLYLIPYIFGWEYQGLGFDVALHWGTLVAVLWIFWRDYLRAFRDRRFLTFLVIGSMPAAAAGFLLQSQVETVFRNPLVSVFTLTIFGILLWVADKQNSPQPSLWQREGESGPPSFTKEGAGGSSGTADNLSLSKSLFIGIAQALAIVPGVSRSGATMTAGLFSGMSRVEAARFSFLLSGPIIFGAGLVELKKIQCLSSALRLGFLAAAISSFLAIMFLLK